MNRDVNVYILNSTGKHTHHVAIGRDARTYVNYGVKKTSVA